MTNAERFEDWITYNEREIQLNQYSEDFLKIWISMMFYKSSSWLSKIYWEFIDDSKKFSKKKYEEFLSRVISSIGRLEINLPSNIKVDDILKTNIENFSDETKISWWISGLYSWTNFVDNEEDIKNWIKSYYQEQLNELKDKADLVDFTVDSVRELVAEILEWFRID